jgi:hypothetical protein
VVLTSKFNSKSNPRLYGTRADEDEPKPRTPKTHPCDAVGSAQAARMLGITRKTLANWRNLGIGPQYLKYGGRLGPVRYRVADLAEWREAQLRTPAFGGGYHG